MKADVPVVRCPTCSTPYVLRLAMSMFAGERWIYQRDCKHRAPLPAGELDAADVEVAPLTVLRVTPDGV